MSPSPQKKFGYQTEWIFGEKKQKSRGYWFYMGFIILRVSSIKTSRFRWIFQRGSEPSKTSCNLRPCGTVRMGSQGLEYFDLEVGRHQTFQVPSKMSTRTHRKISCM